MIGVFEAGGTKTEFIFGDRNRRNQLEAGGIHPMFMPAGEIQKVLQELLSAAPDFIPEEIWFYGASCGSHEMSGKVNEVLAGLFPRSVIHVESDLLGTARALCGRNPGFAAILGTGSNACLFDGRMITNRMVSFGFWLGDEGSGGYLGKKVFRAWLKGELPEEFAADAVEIFGTGTRNALQSITESKTPNALVARLGGLAIRNKNIPFFRRIILNSLGDFFEENHRLIVQATKIPLHFSGSVAYYLQEEIKEILQEKELISGVFADRTSNLLFDFHIQNR